MVDVRMSESLPKRPGISTATVESLAGLLAGSCTTLVLHPLDIIKVRMQVNRNPQSIICLIRELLSQKQPIRALYRGLGPNLLGNATGWSSFFFFKSLVERRLRDGKVFQSEVSNNLTVSGYFISSATAGALTSIITNPIWVLKTRILSSNKSAYDAYPSLWTGAKMLWKEEGSRGMFRGLSMSILAVSHGAIQFAVYDPAKILYISYQEYTHPQRSHLKKIHANEAQSSPSLVRMPLSNHATLLLSATAKLIAGTITYPLQLLRSRIQLGHYTVDKLEPYFNNKSQQHKIQISESLDKRVLFNRPVSTIKSIYKYEGVRGFYRGLVPNLIRVMPATWVTFLLYENSKYYLSVFG